MHNTALPTHQHSLNQYTNYLASVRVVRWTRRNEKQSRIHPARAIGIGMQLSQATDHARSRITIDSTIRINIPLSIQKRQHINHLTIPISLPPNNKDSDICNRFHTSITPDTDSGTMQPYPSCPRYPFLTP